MLNVAFGGDLIQDVPDPARHVALGEAGDNVHPVRAGHPFLQGLYGERFCVNSAHHQAAGKLGRGLLETCVSADGINEGFIHENGLCAPPPGHRRRAEDFRILSCAGSGYMTRRRVFISQSHTRAGRPRRKRFESLLFLIFFR